MIPPDQTQIPLTANFAEGDIAGNETLINVFPRKSTGGKYPYTLIHTPGQAFFAELPTSPIKGVHEVNDRGFVFTATKMYEVFLDGSFNELGSVDLSGIVGPNSIEDNGLQIVVVDGFKGYSYDIATDTVAEIFDDDFYPASTVTFQDGRFFFDRKGTQQFFWSDLFAVTFPDSNIALAEGQPDKLLGVLSDHREIMMAGKESIEFWFSGVDPNLPLERNQGAFIEKGCAAPHTIVKQNNTIYFIGSDLMVYQLVGYSPQRISTHAVEKDLKGVDLSDAFAYAHEEEGQLFYVLTIPAQLVTWRYDISTSTWHQMQDYRFGRHRSCCKMFFQGKTIVGDFQSGRLFELTRKHLRDDEDTIIRQFVLPRINNGREFLSISSLELDMSTGLAPYTGVDSNPVGYCEFSKDAGETWSNKKRANIGKKGEYLQRVKWNRFGSARQFDKRITIPHAIPIDIGGAWIEAD